MPYVDKILKSEYQKRTATPYMKEWRENNREHHRKYIREWAAKRRANKEVHRKDLDKQKQTESYKINCKLSKYRSRLMVAGLTNTYIVGLLTKHSKMPRKLIYDNPEIIQIHKKIVLTKRLLKNDNTSNKQL